MLDCPLVGCNHKCRDEMTLFVHVAHSHSKVSIITALIELHHDTCPVCRKPFLVSREEFAAHLSKYPKNQLVESLLRVFEEKEATKVVRAAGC